MPCRFASSGTVATSRSASRAILALNVASNFLRDLVISVLHRLRQSRTLHTLTFGPISGVHFTDRLRQHAADLAKRNLSVIVTAGPQPVRALLEAKVTSPIVFAILSDPVTDGFVQSLARPGGTLTGLSMVGTDLESKRMQILKDSVPA